MFGGFSVKSLFAFSAFCGFPIGCNLAFFVIRCALQGKALIIFTV